MDEFSLILKKGRATCGGAGLIILYSGKDSYLLETWL